MSPSLPDDLAPDSRERPSPTVGPGQGEIQLQQMLRREKADKDRLEALLTVSQAMVSSLDLATILDTIAEQVRRVVQVDECTVFLLDADAQVLLPAACNVRGFGDEIMKLRLQLGEGITGMVALSGRGEIVNSAESDPRALDVPNTPDEESSLLCVPLFSRETVIGVITLARIGPGRRLFAGDDLEIARLFAAQASAAIANARMYERTREAYDQLRATQSQLVQSAKLNALGEMAGGVAHDFNNILAAILGRTQLLLREIEGSDARRQLEVIEQAALDGASAVRRVQEFSRLRQDERFEPVNLNQVLADVVELTQPAWRTNAKKLGVQVDVRVTGRSLQSIAGNGSELREVFTNLILNALDAMPQGGEIRISCEDAGDEVLVRIRDTGAGMDAETQARAFDPFFTTKPVKGTGLGLSVAYGIVTRHHGSIVFESQPGVGTEFVLRFPAAASSAPAAPATPDTRREDPPRLRILVVDDEEVVVQVLADMLRESGQQVEIRIGGEAGLAALPGFRPHVVFTDLGMPDVNGWDVARGVKSQDPAIPVVLVTGWGTQLEEGSAQARGVDLIMAKPFSIADVDLALSQVAAMVAPARFAA